MAIIFLDARGKWHTRNGTLSPLRPFFKDTPRGTAPGNNVFRKSKGSWKRFSPQKNAG